jgi:hypothetical protein
MDMVPRGIGTRLPGVILVEMAGADTAERPRAKAQEVDDDDAWININNK